MTHVKDITTSVHRGKNLIRVDFDAPVDHILVHDFDIATALPGDVEKTTVELEKLGYACTADSGELVQKILCTPHKRYTPIEEQG